MDLRRSNNLETQITVNTHTCEHMMNSVLEMVAEQEHRTTWPVIYGNRQIQ